MTTRMSRLPKRMSKALLNDVTVVETALPIFYGLGLQRLGLFFPATVGWCLSLSRMETKQKSSSVLPGAHRTPHEKVQTTTHTNARSETRRKTKRNKSSRDKKVTRQKRKRFRSFFSLKLVCVGARTALKYTIFRESRAATSSRKDILLGTSIHRERIRD